MVGSGNPSKTSGVTVRVDPKAADPDIPSSEFKVGVWLVTVVTVENMLAVPAVLVLIV
jgi:hypothetical protein